MVNNDNAISRRIKKSREIFQPEFDLGFPSGGDFYLFIIFPKRILFTRREIETKSP